MQDLVEFALDIARGAGRVTLEHFRAADLAVDRKADGTEVTVADRAAERYLRERIAERFPDDAIVGEEEGGQAGPAGRTWYLDPIDGTTSFVHGVPLYANLVACHDAEGCAVGVINIPALDEAVWAGRGLGCFTGSGRAAVSATTTLDRAMVVTSGIDHWPEAMRARAVGDFTLRTWGDGYGYLLVATGRADAMVDPEVKVWDLGPMPVIFREAGGRFSDLTGVERHDGGSALASNGHLHDALLAHLAGRQGD